MLSHGFGEDYAFSLPGDVSDGIAFVTGRCLRTGQVPEIIRDDSIV